VRGALGGPPRLAADGLDPPYVWFQLFMDGGFTELFQWTLLAGLVVLAASLAAAHRLGGLGTPHGTARPGDETGRGAFWTLIAVAAALMLIEDAGNARHLLLHYAGVAAAFDPVVTTVVEITYFAAIASVGLYAFLRYGRGLAVLPGVRGLGAAGVGCYALGAGLNASRTIGYWYHGFGSWLVDDVLGAPQLVEAVAVEGLDPWQLRFLFPDFVVEESLELLGAAFLVAAALAYARLLRRA
jgi:hypothetical protein